jgi:putative transposase
VKTASMTKEKGIDGNKKISGRKRFIITDTSRCALSSARPNFAIFITPANTAERQGAQQVFNEMRGEYPLMAKILAHQGFDSEAFVEKVMLTFGWIVKIVAKIAGVGGFQVLPKRWIVERTFGWLGFQRRLVKDYEQVIEHSTSFIHWAMIRLMVRKLA